MNKNVTENWELKGSNRLAAIGVAVESGIIMVAYLAEYLKGARTIGYAAMIMALCAVIAVSAIVTYVRKPDSTFIKHIVGAGFPILYAVSMFTSDNILTFTYAIPVLIVAASYADSKYSLMESVGMVLVNVVQVILLLKKGVYNSTNTAYLEIHIIIVIIICVFQALSVRRVESNNRYREGLVKDENDKTKQLLESNVSIGTETNRTIDEMFGIITELGDSIRSTAAAMAEVDQGATETADNVATQRELTADISEKVSDVSQNCSDIVDGIKSTLDAVNNGKENMDAMIVQAEKTIGNGNEVSEKLVELNQFMEKLGSVVKIISQITSQTSLLSLNASIEAARAGEAGRGFSVVASEIQTMANNTQSAANEISVMLSDVSGAIDAVVSAATEMIENIKVQEHTIRTAADSFATIEKNAVDISSISEGLSDAIMKLENSNREIDNSISSISAVTEQVSAHANDTVASCESNIETVDRVIDMSKQLRELAGKLSE